MVLLMCGIFAAAYYTSKLVGRQYQGKQGRQERVKVIDRAYIGKNQAILVTRAGDKVFLLGATPQSITLISELPAEQFCEDEAVSNERVTDFITYLKDAKKSRSEKKLDGSIDGKDGSSK